MAGTLFLIAGPSGAGKDTLMGAVRDELTAAGTHVFPRRIITRPEGAGGEDHIAVPDREFDAHKARGELAFDWSAHGYRYGIGRDMFGDLAAGRHVVINLSRTIVGLAQAAYPRTRFILVDAAPEVLRSRLAARGRESASTIDARLDRHAKIGSSPEPDVVLCNTGALADAVAAFRAALVDGLPR